MRTFSIILADDEQNILYGMEKGINWEKLGFTVAGTAQNGKEVLEMMDDLHPDLVISDIKMPFMDGLELAKTIHENYMNTKVILFSGWDDFEYARLAISYGVSEYIMKPIDYDEMNKLLTNMHQTLEEEYNEKINWTRLEYAYLKSLPLLRQQFFTQLVLGTMNQEECNQQIKNLGLELENKDYCIIAVKIQKADYNDVFSALSIKETLKESLDKISKVYEFGVGDKEIFLLTGDQKHEVGKITRSIQETSIMITRIFNVHISCGISDCVEKLEDIPNIYTQAMDALEYNLVVPDECYTYYNDLMLQEEVETDWNTVVEQIGKIITYCKPDELKKRVDNNVILVENAKKIVQENFSDPDLSVESVCDALHVSTSHFSKIFKQETGGTFMNYMIGLRMEHAKKLLLQTNYKSLVIGEMVGYPEPNYFSYVFKKNCGVSPAKYRKLENEK